MDRPLLEKFISKYNLAGSCESVTYQCLKDVVKVRAISADKNVLAEVTLDSGFLPEGKYSIYETTKFRSMIGILGDQFSVTPLKNNDVVHAVKFVDASDTEVIFVLSDESIIPPVPDLKTLPKFELKIDLDQSFVKTFVNAKSALTEAETFAVSNNGEKTEIVLGFSSINTNRIKIKTNSNEVDKFDPISFSANYFKNILVANKEITTGKMEVSSKGLARITFNGDDVKSVYYLVQIAVDV